MHDTRQIRPRSPIARLVVLVLVGAAMLALAPTAAVAQTGGSTDSYPTVPTTPTTVACTDSGGGASVCGTAVAAPRSDSANLPFTGGDAALLAVLGIAALAGGGMILVFSRRRSSPRPT